DGGFIVKFDYNGNPIWSTVVNGSCQPWGICADSAGNTYITGEFNTPMAWFGNSVLYLSDGPFFIAKYDPNGNALWARSTVGPNNDGYGFSVSADHAGNVFVTGWYGSDTLDFGSVLLLNNGPTYSRDLFLCKYSASGNLMWARSAGGTDDDFAYEVAADPNGNAYVTGYYKSTSMSFGSIPITNAGSLTEDVFLAKYDANGNAVWAKSIGGSGDENANGLATDKWGNVFLGGEFFDSLIDFGIHTIVNTNQTSGDVFIVKYDSLGNDHWAHPGRGPGSDFLAALTVDTSGNVYATGELVSGTITFGTMQLSIPPNSPDPVYLIKLDSAGYPICGTSLQSGGDDQNDISADRFGNVYMGGDYLADPFIIGNDTLIYQQGEGIFMAKYNCNIDAGIEELNGEEIFTLAPDPTDGAFTIYTTCKHGEIFIYNDLGEIVLTSTLDASPFTIDLSNRSAGIYFVRMNDGTKTSVQKIIKK
ncbi:MAG TPA: SBBP repeat-containing protein, partial [Bacteroidia bacterium]|nr:SBBP repeat-containing protein [Bacteroidia bacterium]